MQQRLKCTALILPAALAVVAACDDGGSRWAGTITDSAGVTIVANPAEGIWTEADRWTLEEDLRIGVQEGDPDHQFGEIGAITIDSHGRIFVLDVQSQQIKIYTADGIYQQTLGSRGDGPGEMQWTLSVLIGPGDTLLVPDRRLQRMNRFAPDGSFINSTNYSREDGVSLSFRTNSSGVVAEQVRPLVVGRRVPDDPEDAIVLWAPDGTRVDTLASFPSGGYIDMSGPRSTEFHLYSPEPCWDLTETGGLLFGVNDAYRFEISSSGGRLERVVTKAHEPRPVTERDIGIVRTHLEEGWRNDGAPPDLVLRLLKTWHFNDFFPAFQALYEGPAGTVWVQKVKPPSEMTKEETAALNFPNEWVARKWDVFDSDGRFLGQVAMPTRFTPRVFRGDRIYGVWRDELDVSYVVRLHVVGDVGVPAAP